MLHSSPDQIDSLCGWYLLYTVSQGQSFTHCAANADHNFFSEYIVIYMVKYCDLSWASGAGSGQ